MKFEAKNISISFNVAFGTTEVQVEYKDIVHGINNTTTFNIVSGAGFFSNIAVMDNFNHGLSIALALLQSVVEGADLDDHQRPVAPNEPPAKKFKR